MKRKIKIAYLVCKKAINKSNHIFYYNKNFYKGKGFVESVSTLIQFPFKHGIIATIQLAKNEMIRISSVQNIRLNFPNGMVSGIDQAEIQKWKAKASVTIVIPSYNDFDLLRKCLNSIYKTCTDLNYEIIIVDDYCVEENRKKLRTLIEHNTKVVFRKNNGGFARAVNTGLKKANKTNDVVILNSDTEANDGWLKALQYGAYEFGNKVGIVGPKLLYPDGRIQSAGSFRNTESVEWFDHYYRFQPSDYGPANVPNYCIAVTGACQYIKREFINKIGILDEGFQFAFEEVDWCLRGWENGYKTLYFPASVLTHHEGVVRKKNKNISTKEIKSKDYFWKKWGNWFDKRNVLDNEGRVRIIFILQSWGLSGGIKNVIEHANRLATKGFATEVWSLDRNNPAWEIKVPKRTFTDYQKLTSALEKEEAIKVATWWETAFPVWLSSIKKGIAVYMIQEIESWFYPNDPDAQRVVISCYRKEFTNVTISGYNLEEIKSLGLRATLIPCGYDSNTFKKINNITKRNNVLLAVGRTFFQKNFKYSFEAWKLLGSKRPQFWLYGSEPEMKRLDSKIKYSYKPSDKQVNELYNQATVFVQTSYHEGFCIPIIEAMAAGTPVVCTDAHGNRDFCKNGKTCIMVEQDNKKQLKDAYIRLFKDRDLRTKLAQNGIKEAKKYTWPVITDKLVSFYSNVAKSKNNKV